MIGLFLRFFKFVFRFRNLSVYPTQEILFDIWEVRLLV